MTQPLFKIEIFLEYWFVLWEEMFRPTDVLQRGALKQVCLLYFAVLFFLMLTTSSMEIPGSGDHSHPQYYMGMVRAITKVLNEMKM